MVSYGFHSEAADEYLAATRYYLDHASPLVAAAFLAEIEGAIQTLLASPHHLANSRRASSSLLRVKAISIFGLSLGAGPRKSFNIRSHAFQQTAWVLASSHLTSNAATNETRNRFPHQPYYSPRHN
jgi:plasmid stabilization system protein ParE